MRPESLERLPVKHLPVVRMGYAYHQLRPLLETLAIEVDCSVFCHYPVCVRPRGDHSGSGVEFRHDLVLAFVGP